MSIIMLLLFPLVFVVAAAVAAIVLRASIALFNRMSGANHQNPREIIADTRPANSQNVAKVPDTTNPYSAPAEYIPRAQPADFARGVPTAGFGKAFGIVLLYMLIGTVTNLMISFAISRGSVSFESMRMAEMAAGLLGIVIQYVILVGLLKAILPTTIGKACLVALLFGVIAFVIAMALGLVAGFLMVFLG